MFAGRIHTWEDNDLVNALNGRCLHVVYTHNGVITSLNICDCLTARKKVHR